MRGGDVTVVCTGGQASNKSKPKAGVYVDAIRRDSTGADVCISFAGSVTEGTWKLWILGNLFIYAARKTAGCRRKHPEINLHRYRMAELGVESWSCESFSWVGAVRAGMSYCVVYCRVHRDRRRDISTETTLKAIVYVDPIRTDSIRAAVWTSFAGTVTEWEWKVWILRKLFMHAARKSAGCRREDPEIYLARAGGAGRDGCTRGDVGSAGGGEYMELITKGKGANGLIPGAGVEFFLRPLRYIVFLIYILIYTLVSSNLPTSKIEVHIPTPPT